MSTDFIKNLVIFLLIIASAWVSLYFINEYGDFGEDADHQPAQSIFNFNLRIK